MEKSGEFHSKCTELTLLPRGGGGGGRGAFE